MRMTRWKPAKSVLGARTADTGFSSHFHACHVNAACTTSSETDEVPPSTSSSSPWVSGLPLPVVLTLLQSGSGAASRAQSVKEKGSSWLQETKLNRLQRCLQRPRVLPQLSTRPSRPAGAGDRNTAALGNGGRRNTKRQGHGRPAVLLLGAGTPGRPWPCSWWGPAWPEAL